MPATYDGLEFRTELDARWAAFFDLAGWSWWYNPAPIDDWKPDFRVRFVCKHSECDGQHTLLVSVLPVAELKGLSGHPALRHPYGTRGTEAFIPADAGALFGSHPEATTWEMSHGAGGGTASVVDWVDHAVEQWQRVGERVSGT